MANTIYKTDSWDYMVCKWCNEKKLLTDFYAHKKSKSWFSWRCKVCVLSWRKTERELDMARTRDHNRYYNNNSRRKYLFDKAISNLNSIEWRRLFYSRTLRHIKKLGVSRDVCSICGGKPDTSRIEAHHPDYNYWNKVIICCTICHRKLDMWKIDYKEHNVINLLPFGQ